MVIHLKTQTIAECAHFPLWHWKIPRDVASRVDDRCHRAEAASFTVIGVDSMCHAAGRMPCDAEKYSFICTIGSLQIHGDKPPMCVHCHFDFYR